jgi:hypothetical protein
MESDIKKFAKNSLKNNIHTLPDKPVVDDEPSIEILTLVDVARKYPRNIKSVIENCLSTLDDKTAMKWFYVIRNGNDRVKMPTIYLARLISQFYGNIRIESRMREIIRHSVVSDAVAIDLETMTIFKSEGSQSFIIDPLKKLTYDDMIIATTALASAKAMRKAIFNIIPAAITDKLLSEAQEAITGDISNLEKLISKRNEIVDVFSAYGVSDTQIQVYFKKELSKFDQFDIIELVSLLNQIIDGDLTIKEIF